MSSACISSKVSNIVCTKSSGVPDSFIFPGDERLLQDGLISAKVKSGRGTNGRPTRLSQFLESKHSEWRCVARWARCVCRRLQPLRHSRLDNRPIQENDKEHLPQWSLNRVRKEKEAKTEPAACGKSPSSVSKAYSSVPPFPGSASIPKQLNRHDRGRQHEADKDGAM